MHYFTLSVLMFLQPGVVEENDYVKDTLKDSSMLTYAVQTQPNLAYGIHSYHGISICWLFKVTSQNCLCHMKVQLLSPMYPPSHSLKGVDNNS